MKATIPVGFVLSVCGPSIDTILARVREQQYAENQRRRDEAPRRCRSCGNWGFCAAECAIAPWDHQPSRRAAIRAKIAWVRDNVGTDLRGAALRIRNSMTLGHFAGRDVL